MKRFVCLIVAALVGAVLSLDAQRAGQQNPNAPRFRATVDLVEMDVAVLDKDRQPVRGLTPADFTILENQQPQTIAAFSEVNVPEPVEPPAVWMREVSPDVKSNSATDRRLFVLVLDDAMTKPDPYVTSRIKEIGHIVVDRLGPEDMAAVIFTLDDRKAQDFTNDRARLLAAIDKFSPGFGGGNLFNQYPLNVIDKIAEYLTDVPQQRKALIFVSPGVPIDLATLTQTSPTTQRGTGSGGRGQRGGGGGASGIASRTPGDTAGPAATLHDLTEDIFRMAARANVSVYGISPGGLDTAPGFDPGRDFLQSLSEGTGGFAVTDSNKFDWSISQIFAENGSYYLLGYQSPNPTQDGKFRKTQILVNRPGVTVHSRNGYYAPKPDTPRNPAPSPLTKAVTGLIPTSGMQMRVNVTPFAIPGKSETALAIALGLRQPTPAHTERLSETINLTVNAYDTKGQPKSIHREDAKLVLKPGPDDEVQYEVLTRMDLKPGNYQLRLAAYSASLAKSGSIYVDVEVPDFTKPPVSLSGVIVSASPPLPAGPPNVFAGLSPVAPTTLREFEGHQASAFMRVYQAKSKLEDVLMKVRLIDVNDAIAFERDDNLIADKFIADRSADYRLDLPLARLKPGPYNVTFDALLAGGKSAHRDVQIFVR